MELLIGILLLVGGAIIGYFVARFQLQQDNDAEQQFQQQQQHNAIAQGHILETTQLLDALDAQSKGIREQLAQFESALSAAEETEDKPQLTFFGDQASAYLRNAQRSDKRPATQAEDQPRDYSGDSSGLFNGAKNQQSTVKE